MENIPACCPDSVFLLHPLWDRDRSNRDHWVTHWSQITESLTFAVQLSAPLMHFIFKCLLCTKQISNILSHWTHNCCRKNGAWQDGRAPGLEWVPGMGHQVRVLGFMQERIQERATVKWKQVYLERYTLHRQSVGHLRRREATPGHGVLLESESSPEVWEWLVIMGWVTS